jgi:TPR repeat protein
MHCRQGILFLATAALAGSPSLDLTSLPLPASTPPPKPHRATFNLSAALSSSIFLSGYPHAILDAHLTWPDLPAAPPASFSILPALVAPAEVASLLALLRPHAGHLDEDADSVDGLATREIYLEKDGSVDAIARIAGKPDADAAVRASRGALRAALLSVTRPVQAQRLVPLVNARYPRACAPSPCRVCHSLVRRYAQGERLEHPRHFDVQALVTVVVPLSTSGADFEGGLYVSTGATEALLPLAAGDAVVHQSNLLHGVAVGERAGGERWSWILWFKNVSAGSSCDGEDGSGWAAADAAAGDPVAAFLHARRARSPTTARHFLRRSAEAGFSRAANELGHSLRQGGGAARREEGLRWLKTAAAAGEAEGLYNLALAEVGQGGGGNETLAVALWGEAARRGLAVAAANVAVAFASGKGGVARDLAAAAAWWERAGDGDSLQLAARVVESEGDAARGAALLERAARVGHAPAAEELARRAAEAGGPTAARPWLLRAARSGSAAAAAQLRELERGGAAAAHEL